MEAASREELPRWARIVMLVLALQALLGLFLTRLYPAETPQQPAIHARIEARQSAIAKIEIPEGASVFLGDSITEQWPASDFAPGAVNLGVSGLRTDQLLRLLSRLHTLDRAGRIYLLIGVNDLATDRNAGLRTRLAAISGALPDKPLVWSGIMPNERGIDQTSTNEAIRDICAARPRCVYVDTSSIHSFRDGLHLTQKSYTQWRELLNQVTIKR